MATFEKRGNFWRAKIRRAGLPAQTRTFDNKTLAQRLQPMVLNTGSLGDAKYS